MPEDNQNQPRDGQGRFMKKAGDAIRENQETGDLEMKVKVDGEQKFVPLDKAQELTQKGQHYTENMQEARRLQKEAQQKLESAQQSPGGQGVESDLSGQSGGPVPGSGTGSQNGGQYPNQPSLDPGDIPDPIDNPEGYRKYMGRLSQYVQQVDQLKQEVDQLKNNQQTVNRDVAKQKHHEMLQRFDPDFDEQAAKEVEDEITRREADPTEDARGLETYKGRKLVYLELKNQGKIGSESDNDQNNQPQNQGNESPNRETPHSEGNRNAPPASGQGSGAPQGTPENEEEAYKRYLQFNEENTTEPSPGQQPRP